ncbi:SDR family oxidoreductase [Actinotalea sp. BY-33]|uniref:SDR family oxidoreductase n=1 Tax=Actinotalea soli TaxID=2819234 RepID=A0A939LRD9_9CELL|nr:SDR family oxidoreductase [Actinotalea soli]MBO1751655.1 SDR family oxidoreductase [Actinotalea soli]
MTSVTTEPTSRADRKVVLITGASSGIGAATAVALAAEGHAVVLGARRADRLDGLVAEIRAAGGTAAAVHLDVTNRADLQRAVAHAVTTFGSLDVLVNNAGVMPLSALSEGKVEEWDWMIDVNLRGVLHGIAAAEPVMRRQGWGHVITVASTGAHEVVPTAAVYCATKYAAWAVSEGLRVESGPWLRVTTITPGVVESELAETISDDAAREAMEAYRAAAIPAAEVAAAIRFAIDAGKDVDVNEIILRPTAQRP